MQLVVARHVLWSFLLVSPWIVWRLPGVQVPRLRVQLALTLDAEPGRAGYHVSNGQWRAHFEPHVNGQQWQQILHDCVTLRLCEVPPCAQAVQLEAQHVFRGVVYL